MEYFIKAWDWIKSISQKGINYYHEHELIAIIALTSAIVLVYYIFAFLFQTGDYNKKLIKKLRRLNIIVRNYQIKGDRESFLSQFNKETAKKQKAFSKVWNEYLKSESKVAGEFFKESGLKSKHKRFLGPSFFVSVLLALGASISLLVLTKFDFKNISNIYIPIFALFYPFALAGLFQSIYFSISGKKEKQVKSHLKFFVENIDESLSGFTKDDLNLTGGKPVRENKANNPNVESYDTFVASGKSELTDLDREYLEKLAKEKLAEQQVQKSLDIVNDEIEEGIESGHLEERKDGIAKGYRDQTQLLRTLEKLKNTATTKEVQKTEELENALEEQNEEFDVKKTKPARTEFTAKKRAYMDDEEDITKSLEELIEAKKTRVQQREKALETKQPNKNKKTTKGTSQKPKKINDALEDLLASARRNKSNKSSK